MKIVFRSVGCRHIAVFPAGTYRDATSIRRGTSTVFLIFKAKQFERVRRGSWCTGWFASRA